MVFNLMFGRSCAWRFEALSVEANTWQPTGAVSGNRPSLAKPWQHHDQPVFGVPSAGLFVRVSTSVQPSDQPAQFTVSSLLVGFTITRSRPSSPVSGTAIDQRPARAVDCPSGQPTGRSSHSHAAPRNKFCSHLCGRTCTRFTASF